MPKGILVDYEWCTGCHTCEMACKVEKNLPDDQWGIKLTKVGPYNIQGDDWVWINFPVFTDQCDLCAERVAAGKKPTCVHHCQADIMRFGEIDELVEELKRKPKQVLFTLEA